RGDASDGGNTTSICDRQLKSASDAYELVKKPKCVKKVGLPRRVGSHQEVTVLDWHINDGEVPPVFEADLREFHLDPYPIPQSTETNSYKDPKTCSSIKGDRLEFAGGVRLGQF